MRRVFIIRKDLHLTPGKLAAMVGHAAELYWLNLIKNGGSYTNYGSDNNPTAQSFEFFVPYEVWTDYINGIYTKTICESRNISHLMKAKAMADELGLKENEDYGFINDKCLTELKPENKDETTTVGMWFAPLPDNTAHKISRKFPLYRDHSSADCLEQCPRDENMSLTESERIRRFNEICKQSEGGLQTFK